MKFNSVTMMKFISSLCLLFMAKSVMAGSLASILHWESPVDKKPITGFIMQDESVKEDAPVAFLLHGMNTHSFHWIADGGPTYGGKVTQMLLNKGYRVIALDARAHGHRKYNDSAETRLTKAKFGFKSGYYDMIQNTVKDYEFALKKVKDKFKQTSHMVAIGYSMGAQMAIMFSAQNPEVNHLITMVPPHTGGMKDVSPVEFAPKVKANWLLFLAKEDEYNDTDENEEIAMAIKSKLTRIDYDSGHILPQGYIDHIEKWIDSIK